MKKQIRQYAREYPAGSMHSLAEWVIEQSKVIQQIPAPTFEEQARAAYVQQQFEQIGLADVRADALHNIYGRLPGANPALPGILIMAHTDTVFPLQTDLTLRTENNKIKGPGLGDNSIGVGGILGLAHYLQTHAITPACPLWFVATSREEGLGNLDGARQAFDTLRDQIAAVINVEGLAYGYIYHAGIAVRRLHITTHAQGGHSWLHFGQPSAVHAIMALGAAITQLDVPATPRTTYNIGMIEGGHSINSIATEAGLWLDLRSESPNALAALEAQVRDAIQRVMPPDVSLQVEVVGERPAGHLAPDHPLIVGALAALSETGTEGALQIGSTDGNIPLSHGCPTVTLGITRGGHAHRLDEFIEIGPTSRGLRQLLLVTLAAADYQAKLVIEPYGKGK